MNQISRETRQKTDTMCKVQRQRHELTEEVLKTYQKKAEEAKLSSESNNVT